MDIKSILKKIFPKKGEPAPESGARLRISLPMLVAISLVLVCAVGWAFFMGLMVGRGQNPKASIQTITGINVEESPAASKTELAVLPDRVLPEPKSVAQKQPEAEIPPPAAAPAPRAEKAHNIHRPAAQPKPAPGQQYDYIFQAGAFKTQTEAKRVNATLNKNGLRSTVSKSGRVYLVVVSLRGGANEVAAMQKKMRELKIGKPMQLSRKPVEKRQSRRNGQR